MAYSSPRPQSGGEGAGIWVGRGVRSSQDVLNGSGGCEQGTYGEGTRRPPGVGKLEVEYAAQVDRALSHQLTGVNYIHHTFQAGGGGGRMTPHIHTRPQYGDFRRGDANVVLSPRAPLGLYRGGAQTAREREREPLQEVGFGERNPDLYMRPLSLDRQTSGMLKMLGLISQYALYLLVSFITMLTNVFVDNFSDKTNRDLIPRQNK